MKKEVKSRVKESGSLKIIRKAGGSRIISLPKNFPEDWEMVRITMKPVGSDGSLTLKFERMA